MRPAVLTALPIAAALFIAGCSSQPQADVAAESTSAPMAANTQVPGMRRGMPPNAPADKLVSVTLDMQERVQSLSEQARRQLPELKRRFLKGLPKGQTMFVMADVHDNQGQRENAFVQVLKWEDGHIFGAVASDMVIITNVHFGDAINVLEKEVIDWVISRPDGTEEGNAVGKYTEVHGLPYH